MKLSEFDYILPPELIAQHPVEPRDSSKLLMLNKNTGKIADAIFSDMKDTLGKNDVLVMNKTRVINARLNGIITEKDVPCEVFLHKQLSDSTWDCLVYPGKKLKPGTAVHFIYENGDMAMQAHIIEISEKGRIVEFSEKGQTFFDIIDTIGNTPLPPYIKEKVEDPERYQTVYNETKGSVAAPTAGLHFTPELIDALIQKGVHIEYVTLHVGLGTFANVEVENIEDHHMHTEQIFIEDDVTQRLNTYKREGKRIIAVGTTSVRTLESMSDETGQLESGQKETDIFIYPGYTWKFVDSMITNFHLPKSTLVMLVSSLAGQESIKKAYEHAIREKYRFFSFGDAMWITDSEV